MAESAFAGAMRLDGESLRTQARLEALFPGFRPDAQHTTGRERTPAALDGQASVERIALGIRSRMGAFEEIQHDGVKACRASRCLSNAIRYIANLN